MLALKLFLVPSFLLLVSLAGRRWGPAITGWLAGLPVVAGPILYMLALEQGRVFAAAAVTSALGAVLAAVSFGTAYAHCAQRYGWPIALLAGLVAWFAAASLVAAVPSSVIASATIALTALLAAPYMFPKTSLQANGRSAGNGELVIRMLAGAALTVSVTLVANLAGARWSGLLAVFPVLGTVLAVFSHRAGGAQFSATVLRGMATGLYSFAAFGLVLSLVLPLLNIHMAFALSVLAALTAQIATKPRAPSR